MSKNKKYQILSPDGFRIHLVSYFTSKKQAKNYFKYWIERYETQGYYSSTQYGKIELTKLESYCTLIEI